MGIHVRQQTSSSRCNWLDGSRNFRKSSLVGGSWRGPILTTQPANQISKNKHNCNECGRRSDLGIWTGDLGSTAKRATIVINSLVERFDYVLWWLVLLKWGIWQRSPEDMLRTQKLTYSRSENFYAWVQRNPSRNICFFCRASERSNQVRQKTYQLMAEEKRRIRRSSRSRSAIDSHPLSLHPLL